MSKLLEKLLDLCQFKLNEQRQAFELKIAELREQVEVLKSFQSNYEHAIKIEREDGHSKYDAAYGIIRGLERDNSALRDKLLSAQCSMAILGDELDIAIESSKTLAESHHETSARLAAEEAALRSLMNETNAFVSIAQKDSDWKYIWGVTNMNCIKNRIADAAETLAAIDAARGEKGK
jgi:hypothetical protein